MFHLTYAYLITFITVIIMLIHIYNHIVYEIIGIEFY